MRHNRIVLLLALILLMMSLPALAEDAGLEITDIHAQSDGSVYVAWRDDGEGAPYQVLFQPASVPMGTDEAPSGQATVWCNSGEVEVDHYVEPYIAPDCDYWFILQSADGRQTWARYEGEALAGFGPWNVFLTPMKIYKSSNSISYEAIDWFSKEDLLAMDESHSYGFELSMKLVSDGGGVIFYENPLLLVAEIGGEPQVVGGIQLPLNEETTSGFTLRQDLGDWFRWLYGDCSLPSYQKDIFQVRVYLNGGCVGSKEMFILK